MSNALSSLVNIESCSNIDEIIDTTYCEFKNNYMDRERRPKTLFGKRLIIEFANWVEYKADSYWHLVSLNEDEKFNVFPCGNKLSDHICLGNCISKDRQIVRYNGDVRNICIYRALRVNWPLDIIRLANEKSQKINIWEKDRKLHLRYKKNKIDYIVILAIKKDSYKLISAFPVFYINKKKAFDKDFEEYNRHKKSQ